uniref:Glycosylphosphatidylinositol anchor attachment 1 protein n=2 Tax=Trichobilharzia regenti TaxID=157069 RepID=A0AA85ISV7_TRIRE|nr:unnamed protein product [Trichobilharzia regenti]
MVSVNKQLQYLKFIENHSTIFGLILYLIGLIWFCLLSQDELNFKTYMSENALLVGQVNEIYNDVASTVNYYQDSNNAFKHNGLAGLKQWLSEELHKIGLEVYSQDFSFSHDILSPIEKINGSNLYAIMRSPSGGRTEALIIITSLNDNPAYFGSLAYALSLSKLFRSQIHWAKDIIFLFPEYEYIGLMAWLEAYHGTANSNNLFGAELEGRSGSIQAGLNLEFLNLYQPIVDILPEGPNGLLANLDLTNTVVRLAESHSIVTRVNRQSYAYTRGTYQTRMNDMLGLMEAVWTQSTNSPSGLHGPLINYQIPAITLRGNYKKRTDDPRSSEILYVMRLLEGILRSLNNLQERLHQSFWYYLLPNPYRYISIGVYMPPVLIMILSLLLKPLLFWIFSKKSTFDSQSTIKKELKVAKKVKTTSHDGSNHHHHHHHHHENDADKQQPQVEHSHMKNLNNITEDNQTIRQRKIKSPSTEEGKHENKVKAKQIEMNKPSPSAAASYPGAIPPHILGLILRLSLCFSAGFCLQSSPKYIFKFINLLIDNQLIDSNTNKNDLFLIVIVALVIFIVMFLPIMMLVLRKLMMSYNDEKDKEVLIGQLCLLSWSLFLSCLTCLNISSAVMLSIPIVPLLHLLIQNSSEIKRSLPVKLMKWFLSSAWLLICTPVLIILMCMIRSSIQHNNNYSTTLSINNIHSCFERCLLQSLIEADLFGCWTWSVVTCGYTSLWLLTWLGIFF